MFCLYFIGQGLSLDFREQCQVVDVLALKRLGSFNHMNFEMISLNIRDWLYKLCVILIVWFDKCISLIWRGLVFWKSQIIGVFKTERYLIKSWIWERVLSIQYGLIYILSPFKKKKMLSSGAFKLSGRTACLFSFERPAVHVLNSQSVVESGWFFPPFDGKLMAQPSWAPGVPGKEKTWNSRWSLWTLHSQFASDSGARL